MDAETDNICGVRPTDLEELLKVLCPKGDMVHPQDLATVRKTMKSLVPDIFALPGTFSESSSTVSDKESTFAGTMERMLDSLRDQGRYTEERRERLKAESFVEVPSDVKWRTAGRDGLGKVANGLSFKTWLVARKDVGKISTRLIDGLQSNIRHIIFRPFREWVDLRELETYQTNGMYINLIRSMVQVYMALLDEVGELVRDDNIDVTKVWLRVYGEELVTIRSSGLDRFATFVDMYFFLRESQFVQWQIPALIRETNNVLMSRRSPSASLVEDSRCSKCGTMRHGVVSCPFLGMKDHEAKTLAKKISKSAGKTTKKWISKAKELIAAAQADQDGSASSEEEASASG